MKALQKSIAEIEAMRNEKIKTIAEFDGWDKPIEFLTPNYLADLNALHRVALDVMEKIIGIKQLKIQAALLSRPINGQYTDLVDAVYDAIVYLKKCEK